MLQDTSILQFEVHPFHLHGNSFYIVGSGSGNYDPATSPATFNLVNPPLRNTYGVPYGGWVAIRFRADNPGTNPKPLFPPPLFSSFFLPLSLLTLIPESPTSSFSPTLRTLTAKTSLLEISFSFSLCVCLVCLRCLSPSACVLFSSREFLMQGFVIAGAWFFHCHFEIHQSWGMETVFFVQEGHGSDQRLPPPPADYPLC